MKEIVSKFLHTPRGFKACSEVHRDEQSDFEPLDELPTTKGIAVADTSIYGKHHHIETVVYFSLIKYMSAI